MNLTLKDLNDRINNLEREQNRAYIYHPDKIGPIERVTEAEKRITKLINDYSNLVQNYRKAIKHLIDGLAEMEQFREDFLAGKFTMRYRIKKWFKL